MKFLIICLILVSMLSFDALAKVKRSSKSRLDFMIQTGYPNGRPGYVVDHIVPLMCNGPDAPENMQWQTIEEAKQKDRWERQWCNKIKK